MAVFAGLVWQRLICVGCGLLCVGLWSLRLFRLGWLLCLFGFGWLLLAVWFGSLLLCFECGILREICVWVLIAVVWICFASC